MIPHTAYITRHATGFIARISYPRDGVAHTESVRGADGATRIFRNALIAQFVADRALRHALNSEGTRPIGKVFTVRQVGGRARITAEANRVFSFGVPAE